MKLRRNANGFALWMLIAGVVVILFIGLAGWVVASKGSSTNKNSATPASSSSASATTQKNSASTDKTVSPPSKAFTVTFPTHWYKRTCSGSGLKDFIMLAPTTSLLGSCTHPPYGIIFVDKFVGDISQSEDDYNTTPYYKDLTFTTVNVGSLSGYKIDYIVGKRSGNDPPSGTAEASYHLYDSNTNETYVVAYSQRSTTPTYKDVFDIIANSLVIR